MSALIELPVWQPGPVNPETAARLAEDTEAADYFASRGGRLLRDPDTLRLAQRAIGAHVRIE